MGTPLTSATYRAGNRCSVGELMHAVFKREQGIRGTVLDHNLAILDALGDVLIYMLDFCNREDIDLTDALELTWKQVKQRDWQKNKYTGVVA